MSKLEELKMVVNAAVRMEQNGHWVNHTEVEQQEFGKHYPDCDMVIGNFGIQFLNERKNSKKA